MAKIEWLGHASFRITGGGATVYIDPWKLKAAAPQASLILISHSLPVVSHLCGRVAVMYLGRIVEDVTREIFFRRPRHPYSELLLRSAPSLGESPADRKARIGELPSAAAPPSGCSFHPRCPHALERCIMEKPALTTDASGSRVACFLYT